MVAGHLAVKSGKYYAVLNYKNAKENEKQSGYLLACPKRATSVRLKLSLRKFVLNLKYGGSW